MTTYNKYIQEYLDIIDNEIFPVCKDQKKLSKFVKRILDTEDLIIEEEKIERYFDFQKYFSLNFQACYQCLLRALPPCRHLPVRLHRQAQDFQNSNLLQC